MVKINKYFVQEICQKYLSQIGYFYIPNKANKKIIVELLQNISFFFFDKDIQNTLFKIINKYQLTSFIDKKEDMKNLCYIIYKEFSYELGLTYKTEIDFYKELENDMYNENNKNKAIKQKNIHSILFSILLVIIILVYLFVNDIKLIFNNLKN